MARTATPNYEQLACDLRALAHPTRIQILEQLIKEEKLSPKQLTERIQPRVSLGTMAHHTRELLSAKMVRTAGVRPVRGAVEHFYAPSAHGRKMYETHVKSQT